MKELIKILSHGAHEKGICTDGYNILTSCATKEELIEYYISNPDWCLERDFPCLGTIETYFSDCGDKGVFANKEFHGEQLNDLQTYIFHNCKGTIKVGLNIEKGIIPMLYFANGCQMNIEGVGDYKLKRPSVIPIYMFGENGVSATDNEYARFNWFNNSVL